MLEVFKQFAADPDHHTMFITGPAGTGKTTETKELVDWVLAEKKRVIVCAFTHKACGILASKLSDNAPITTLWSLLRKRPTVNEEAIVKKYLEVGRQHGQPAEYDFIFVDEFSQVDEKDYLDLNDACTDPETGETRTKIVYIGDLNQLPPVQGMQTINPHGKYNVRLTKIHRTTNTLLEPLSLLVKYIEGDEKPTELEGTEHFIRGADIAQVYKSMHYENDIVLLAFTNERVQELNAEIMGRGLPEFTDYLFSPTTREYYFFMSEVAAKDVTKILKPWGEVPELEMGTKYKALEHLTSMPGISYANVEEATSNTEGVMAYIFGHYNYKQYLDRLKQRAVNANKRCANAMKSSNMSTVRAWAQLNHRLPEAIERRHAWRDYLTFKDCVVCLDFAHALTVHKSQGSTFEYVCLDTEDIGRCANFNFDLYLKLLYVGISRASNTVYTN